MNDITIYRPYKVHAWTLPFTVTVGVFAFVAIGPKTAIFQPSNSNDLFT